MASPNFTADPNQNAPKRIAFPSGVVAEVPSHWSPDIVDDFARRVHSAGQAILGARAHDAASADDATNQPVKRIAFPGHHGMVLEIPQNWSDDVASTLARGLHTAAWKAKALNSIYTLADGSKASDIMWSKNGREAILWSGKQGDDWLRVPRIPGY